MPCRSNIADLLRAASLAASLFIGTPLPCPAQSHPARRPATSPISSADEASFERAMHLLDTGHAAEAQPLLEDLNHRHPGHYEISESLGLLYASEDHLEAALPLLQAGARSAPTVAIAHANLGTAYLKLGRTGDAITAFGRAHELDPANSATTDALGQALLEAKEPCKATSTFATISTPASDPDLPYNTALALYGCGQPDKAAAALAAMPGADSSAPAQSLLGDIEEKRGHIKEAADHYLRATELDPSEPNLYTLGLDLLRHWSFDPAIRTFQTGTERFPASQRMLTGLGIAYYGAARYTDAHDIFYRVLTSNPSDPLASEIYGRSCTVLTDAPAGACTHLIELAQANPGNATLGLYAAIEILHNPADPQQLAVAQQLLTRVLQAAPKLAAAHYQLALLLQQQNRWADSIPELQTALTEDPRMARAHYRLGLAFRRTGHNDEAQHEMTIDRQEDQEQRNDLNSRMQQITTLLVKMQ